MPNAVIPAKSALSLLDLLDSVLEELYDSMNLESVEFYYKVLSLPLKEAGLWLVLHMTGMGLLFIKFKARFIIC